MALSFLQPSLKISYGLLPRFDLDLPMLDEPPIRMRTLLLECDLDSMICDPPSQALKADSQLLVTPHIPPRGCNRTADLDTLSINASRWIYIFPPRSFVPSLGGWPGLVHHSARRTTVIHRNSHSNSFHRGGSVSTGDQQGPLPVSLEFLPSTGNRGQIRKRGASLAIPHSPVQPASSDH
jgi:hypothetical protein